MRFGFQVLSTARRRAGAIALAVTLAAAGVAAAQQAPQSGGQPLPQAQSPGQAGFTNQGVLREQHGDWRIMCESAAGEGAERCGLLQIVESAARPGFGLGVLVVVTPDQATRMRVAVPPGIFLLPGLELRIDGEEVGRAPFWFCSTSRCETEAILNDEILQKLKSGTEAIFVIFEDRNRGTGFVVSLAGFSAGLSALPTWQPPAGAAAPASQPQEPAPAPAAPAPAPAAPAPAPAAPGN